MSLNFNTQEKTSYIIIKNQFIVSKDYGEAGGLGGLGSSGIRAGSSMGLRKALTASWGAGCKVLTAGHRGTNAIISLLCPKGQQVKENGGDLITFQGCEVKKPPYLERASEIWVFSLETRPIHPLDLASCCHPILTKGRPEHFEQEVPIAIKVETTVSFRLRPRRCPV